MKTKLLLLITLILSTQYIVGQTTTTWLGTTSSDWNTPTNWDNGVPIAGDIIKITKTGANDPTIASNITDIYLTIDISAGNSFTVENGGYIEASGLIKNNGEIDINAGGELKSQSEVINSSSGEIINEGTLTVDDGINLLVFTNTGKVSSKDGTFNCEFKNNAQIVFGSYTDTGIVFNGVYGHNSSTLFTIGGSDSLTFKYGIFIYEGKELTVSDSTEIEGEIFNSQNSTLNINSNIKTTDGIVNRGDLNFKNGVIIVGDLNINDDGLINFLPLLGTGNYEVKGSLINRNKTEILTFPTGSTTTIELLYNTNGQTETIIQAGAKLTITETDGKSINNNGVITIQSIGLGASKTGSLITEGTVTGNNDRIFNIERYIDDTTTKWQLVSSPVEAEESGIFTGHYLNYYDELLGEWNNITALDHAISVGEGFVVKWKDITGINPITFSDEFNSGDETRDLLAGVGNTYFDLPEGFNLVGNPYPSNLDWEEVSTANGSLDATYYYYVDNGHGEGTGDNSVDGSGTNGWQTYTSGDGGVNQNISIGQGFGVVITGNTDITMNIPNDARTHAESAGFNKKQESKSNYFKLNAVSNNIVDNIQFQVNNNATENFDGKYDAYKLNSLGYSPTPSFVSADNKKLAVCQTPHVEFINMGFIMESDGEVIFSLTDVADFRKIVLEDKSEGNFTNLMDEDYTFLYSSNDDEYGRFTLHFVEEALNENDFKQNLKIYSYSSNIYVSSTETLENVKVEVLNINGQVVFSDKYSSLKEKQISTGLTDGVYILKVKSNTGVTTQKVSLIK